MLVPNPSDDQLPSLPGRSALPQGWTERLQLVTHSGLSSWIKVIIKKSSKGENQSLSQLRTQLSNAPDEPAHLGVTSGRGRWGPSPTLDL